MVLDDKEILSILEDYVKDERYEQAVLIDGEWGCGKTYFVKNLLIPKLRQEFDSFAILYVSLYGFSNIMEIEDAIYAKWLETCCKKRLVKHPTFSRKFGNPTMNEEMFDKGEKGLSITKKSLYSVFRLWEKIYNYQSFQDSRILRN